MHYDVLDGGKRAPLRLPSGEERTLAKRAMITTFVWAGLVLVATSWPSPDVTVPAPPGLDKLAHLLMYCPLGYFFYRWHFAKKRTGWRILLLFLAGPVLFAVLDELHQVPIPGRFFSFWDIGADWLGILLGAQASRYFCKQRSS